MAAFAGASPASEPPDSSLPPPLPAYSPSHRSIPVTNSPSSSILDLNSNDTVHQFPDLVKKPSFSTNQVNVSTQVSPEIDAAVHTSEHVRVSSDVALTPSVPIHGSYAAVVRSSLPLENPTSADDISSRRAKVNLQLPRVTFPVLNENGIPRVRIPTSVIKEGAARHQEFVALSFLENTPKLGKIHSFLSYLWGKGSKIEVYTLSSGAILARVPSESMRQRIFEVNLWHIDGDAFIAQKWSHQFSFQRPSLEAIPVWVRLNKVPFDLISDAGLNHIAGALGPLKEIKSLNGISSAEVKIEMNLSNPVPNQIELEFEEGRLLLVDVTYLRLPPKCPLCNIIGHRPSSCPNNKPPTPLPLVSDNVANQTNPSVVDPLATGSSDSAEATSSTPIIFAANVSSNPTESDLTLAPSSGDVSHVASVLVPCSTSVEDVAPLCTGKVPSLNVTTQDAPSPPNSHLEVSKESNVVESVTTVDDLIALATITELENMHVSPTLVCINEAIESPTMDSTRALSFSHTSIAPAPLAAEKEVSETAEAVLGSNKFASLISLEGEEEEGEEDEEEEEEEKDPISSVELSSMDLMSPSGRRFLRERPVKPSAKAKEMQLQYTGRGRGNRGRGNRGRGSG